MTAPEIVVFPNAVPVVVAYLSQHLDDGVTVSASVPSNTNIHASLPYVLVVPRGGGWAVRKQLDEVVLNINIYHHAEQLAAIDNLGQLIRAVMESLQQQEFSELGAIVTKVSDQSGLSRQPDSDPLITRVGLTFSLLVRPL